MHRMRTIHVISHTHWDREWYQPFQEFRLRLVHLIDGLLELLERDTAYRHFMLDGQTIVLEDYLHMRPERAGQLRTHVRTGRLLIGPWHILPDEFLVGPEATVRNLLQGDRAAREFGAKLRVGYLPDQFGHIGQMPQILRGFGIEAAVVWRGVGEAPCEIWWQAPDGSRVLAAHLHDGYGNGASLPVTDPDRFIERLAQACATLAPHAAAPHLLIMQGTDHMEPPPATSAALAYARDRLEGYTVVHSTLPDYLGAVQETLGSAEALPVVRGELRSPKRAHLLPGVLSMRMWIKQRNHACEQLLERWVEPFSAWASLAGATTPDRLGHPAAIVRQAWRLLLECHPHDSICGCSVDQVHQEMRPRFDQVEQVGEEITRQSLHSLAEAVDTRDGQQATPATALGQSGIGQQASGNPHNSAGAGGQQAEANAQPPTRNAVAAIVVFNPVAGPRTDRARVSLALPPGLEDFEVVAGDGTALPHELVGTAGREFAHVTLDPPGLRSALGMIQEGGFAGMTMQALHFRREGPTLFVNVVMAEGGEADTAAVTAGTREIEAALADATITTYDVRVRMAGITTLEFAAPAVPGCGYRTFWLRPGAAAPARAVPGGGLTGALLPLAGRLARLPIVQKWLPGALEPAGASRPPFVIENDFFTVEASAEDGTLTVHDRRTGAVYAGLNRFVDGGDCGDEYNYSPPPADRLVEAEGVTVRVERGAAMQRLHIALHLHVPAGLSDDRQARGRETVALAVDTCITLAAGVPRVDVATEVDNPARDHRLRVHFPAPFNTAAADYDGHFEVIRRPAGVPEHDDTWVEQPRPETHQRAFTDISDGTIGLMVANRGLPEVEVIPDPGEIALTLLRCVGWLSRDDFTTRQGHAGPMLATPEAQMLGRHTFDYSIIPHAGAWPQAFRHAYAFDTPLRAVATGLHAGLLRPGGALFAATPDAFVVSAVKAAEDGDGWLVRGYNIGDEPIEVTITPWQPFPRAARANLAEETIAPLTAAADGSVTVPAKGHEIVTVRFGP